LHCGAVCAWATKNFEAKTPSILYSGINASG
jgi:hypothetical protein